VGYAHFRVWLAVYDRLVGPALAMSLDDGIPSGRAMLASLKTTVQEAWHVALLIPDIDARFRKGLKGGSWPFSVIHETCEGYGWHDPWLKECPSPAEISEMEVVMEWMVWLRQRQNGDVDLKRIIGWAIGVPMYILASRERRSVRTIQNRIDRSLAEILNKFLDIQMNIVPIDEMELKPGRIRWFSSPTGAQESGETTEAGKVYVSGIGFMFRGKKYRSSYD
jgi:hypothetical protein